MPQPCQPVNLHYRFTAKSRQCTLDPIAQSIRNFYAKVKFLAQLNLLDKSVELTLQRLGQRAKRQGGIIDYRFLVDIRFADILRLEPRHYAILPPKTVEVAFVPNGLLAQANTR